MDAMTLVVLALRGFVAIVVMLWFIGGIPRLVQTGIAALFGLWTAVLVEATGHAPAGLELGGVLALVLAAREVVIGATLGIATALPLLVAQTAGRLVDRSGNAHGTYAGLFAILAGAVFVGIDGHVAAVSAIAESHRTVPALGDVQPQVLAALGSLVGGAVRLAIPWLVTAAVVELGVGVGVRVAGRAGAFVPGAAAVPAALVMITAALVSTLAVAIAAGVRGTL